MATIVIKDKNLVPQNIKRGVTILKVTGTLDASGGGSVNLQEKTVNSSTVSQNVTPGQGYDGLSKVTVNPYQLDSKTVNSSTSQQVVTSSADGLSSVTVNPYTLDSKTVDPSTSQVTVNSSADGMSSVTVTAVTSSIDQNISAGNIKKDVTILGVTGTFEGGGSAPVLQDVSVSYSQNGEYTLSASSGYDGLGTVDISVNVPSQGGEPWYIQAKRGQITDVSNCSFGGLENINFGAAYALAGTAITTAPQMSFNSVAYCAFKGVFEGCNSMSNADVSIHVDGSIGARAFENAFKGTYAKSLTFDASIISGESCFENAFQESNIKDITFTCTEISQDAANMFSNAFSNAYGTGTISFPNLTTVYNCVFNNAFNSANYDTLSMPNLVNLNYDWCYPLGWMLAYTLIRRFICNPIILNNSEGDYNPLLETWNLKDIEFSANATDNVYLLWQNQLTTSSVYNILTHLDLTVSGKEVSFASWTEWDDQAGEEVQKNLTVYDYPDGRIQDAYDAATTAGWTINNLTIVPTTSLNYITTNRTNTTTIEIPGVKTTDTMMQASGLLNSSGNDIYDRRYIESKNHPNSGTSLFVYFRYGSNEIDLSLGKLNGGNSGDNVYVNGIDFSQVVDSTFGLIKVGNARRAYISSGGNQSTYNADSTFEVDNTDKLVLKMANWYGIKQWEGWDDTSTGGSSKVLVHDYVPVSVTESGTTKYGLFDQVTGMFYTNTGITGA